MPSTVAYLREYLRPLAGRVAVEEVSCRRGGEEVPGTLYRPAKRRGALPAWIVLHGLTCSGRAHPSLTRFARAVAASGIAVLVPEVPEWRALRVAPRLTGATLVAGLRRLERTPGIDLDRVAAFGFSFGATHALTASLEPELSDRLAAVSGWGGYADVRRLFHFGITGEHELDGERYRLEPDPYGRWIMGASYVRGVPGLRSAEALANALYQLALESGRRGVPAWDPVYDPLKRKLRGTLAPAEREVFDLVAPPAGRPPHDMDRAAELAAELAEAAVAAEPGLDPSHAVGRVRVPVLLAHGRGDRLVPFTETVRLERALPPATCRGRTITALFAHSKADGRPRPLRALREGARFLALLRRTLRQV